MAWRLAAAMAGAFGLALAATSAHAVERSRSARGAFVRTHPCPSTAAAGRACPGYVVDHIVPLCAGGADTPRNMQWQPLAESRLKDRDEIRQCRAMRRPIAPP